MAHDGWLKIAQADLTGNTHKVLDLLFYRMRIGNRVEVGQAAIAEDAKMHRPDVTDAISDLVRLDIIQRGEERGVYYINPHIGFVGDSDAHQAAILRWEESKIKTTVAP